MPCSVLKMKSVGDLQLTHRDTLKNSVTGTAYGEIFFRCILMILCYFKHIIYVNEVCYTEYPSIEFIIQLEWQKNLVREEIV